MLIGDVFLFDIYFLNVPIGYLSKILSRMSLPYNYKVETITTDNRL